VAQAGVVEGVVAVGDCVLVADAHGQPVAAVLLDLEGHATGLVALLLERGLEQSEVVVVALGGLDEVFCDHGDAVVLELGAELEVHLGVEDAGVLCGLLQDQAERLDLCPDLGLLALEVLLDLLLDGGDCLLDL